MLRVTYRVGQKSDTSCTRGITFLAHHVRVTLFITLTAQIKLLRRPALLMTPRSVFLRQRMYSRGSRGRGPP